MQTLLRNIRAALARASANEPWGRRLRRWIDYAVIVLAMVWCWDALTRRQSHQTMWAALTRQAQTTTTVAKSLTAVAERVQDHEVRLQGLERR